MKKTSLGKKALTPLLATVLLVAFALAIGTVTMFWGRAYVEETQVGPDVAEEQGPSITLNYNEIDTPLKQLQLDHLLGRISEEEYLEQEQAMVGTS